MKTRPIPHFASLRTWLGLHRRYLIAASAAAGLATVAISCGTFTGTIMQPPQIAGAEFVGSDSCDQCHKDVTQKFKSADHARLVAKGTNAVNVGCESCHGPGSIHVQSGGLARTIVNPRRNPETCYQCHLDKRGASSLPYHHPIEEGRVSCADCHNPHEGRAVRGGWTSLPAAQETCYKCHPAQRGPFIFQHEAIREGCTTCHNPHGSVNQKMLLSRNQDLCLKCHFEQQGTGGAIYIGNFLHQGTVGATTRSFFSRGTCWSTGCHEAIHGSQINAHLRY